MIKQAIILAGGLGTRLRDTVPDLPKCMAPVAGMPFIKHVIRYLLSQGIEKFIFSLGYKHEVIEKFVDDEFPTLNVQYSIEDEPLGTGGAIKLACTIAEDDHVAIVNGDTLFKADIATAGMFHLSEEAACTLLLKPMKDFERYGVVEIDERHRITSFKEKQFYKTGNINAGVYILNIKDFFTLSFPEKFSFEKDYLEKYFEQKKMCGMIQDQYFIDIGIPEDYNRAQEELKQKPLQLKDIDQSWTIFLDRDGVINHEKDNDYIYHWDEFRFYDGVIEAIKTISQKFGKVIIVSNQRGVERGLMTEPALIEIHDNMKAAVEKAGGRIDKMVYCIAKDPKNFSRKPNPGMALLAKKDIPAIDMSKAIMVGNKLSDMQFGRNAGTFTIYVKTTHPDQAIPHPDIDQAFNSLAEFAKAL